MPFPPCRLCKSAPATCRSHIIPKQFFRRVRGKEKHLLELHVEMGIDKCFTQSGIWEQGILCLKCDEKLGLFDDYAYEALPECPKRIEYVRPDYTRYDLGRIDIEKFKMFTIALLWRASVASHPMFDFVKLPAYETKFEGALTGKDSSVLNEVDCAFVHLAPLRYDKLMFPPRPAAYDGVKGLQFYLYPWKLIVKLGKSSFGPKQAPFTLNASGSTYAMLVPEFSTSERRLLMDLQPKIKAHERSRQSRGPKKESN